MRPFLFILLFPSLLIGLSSHAQNCDPEQMIEDCKKELPPYSYSNSRSVMTHEAASREVSVTLMSGEEYRLVFNKEHLPEGSVIRLYGDPKEDSNRDLLLSSKDVPKDQDRFIYDPPDQDGGNIYVSYEIPKAEEMSCFTFVVGYKLAFTED